MQVAERRQVVLPHQDVGVPEERQRVGLGTHLVLQRLDQNTEVSQNRSEPAALMLSYRGLVINL